MSEVQAKLLLLLLGVNTIWLGLILWTLNDILNTLSKKENLK